MDSPAITSCISKARVSHVFNVPDFSYPVIPSPRLMMPPGYARLSAHKGGGWPTLEGFPYSSAEGKLTQLGHCDTSSSVIAAVSTPKVRKCVPLKIATRTFDLMASFHLPGSEFNEASGDACQPEWQKFPRYLKCYNGHFHCIYLFFNILRLILFQRRAKWCKYSFVPAAITQLNKIKS